MIRVREEDKEVDMSSIEEFEKSIQKILEEKKISANLLLPVKILILERANRL